MKLLLGHDRQTKRPVSIPLSRLDRHMHLLGNTGSGKTTALLTLLFQIFCLVTRCQCVIVIDLLGGFSTDLLRWFASPFCPPWVRKRLVYIEGASARATVPMNPLRFTHRDESYYRTARAAEIVLRGWDSQDLSQMPRLMRWLFNAMYAVSQLGLTIVDAAHLLFPHSRLHRPLLACLPEQLQLEWRQIAEARGGQAEIILDSTRNRLKPFFDCPNLRRMFSSHVNHFDVARWMRERRIVIVNLAPMGKLPETAADTIAGLIVNETFAVPRSLPPAERVETILVADEFQNFVGPDLAFNLAESRQLKTRMFLSHQSLSQLKTASTDLTSLIFQAQNRLAFRVAGEDADTLAAEFAGITFDPLRVKDEIWHRCQRVSGHRIAELHSSSAAEQFAQNWTDTYGRASSANDGRTWREGEEANPMTWIRSSSQGRAEHASHSGGGSRSNTVTHGTHETLVPTYEEFMQLSSRTYWTFDESLHEWGRKLRERCRGEAILQIADDAALYDLAVKRTAPGHLAMPWEDALRRLPRLAEDYERLLEENYRQEFFVPPSVVDAEARQRLEQVLRPVIALPAAAQPTIIEPPQGRNPFDNDE